MPPPSEKKKEKRGDGGGRDDAAFDGTGGRGGMESTSYCWLLTREDR